MKNTYLQVTYRHGKILAAYYYLPRRAGDRAVRTKEDEGGFLVDFARDGRAIGIEIKSPSRFTLAKLNRLLEHLGHEPVPKRDVAPLVAA